MSYATRWGRIWTVVAALGVGLGMLEWSAPTTVIALIATTTVAAVVLMILTNELWAVAGAPRERMHWLALALTIGAAVIATLALLTASPVLALLVTVLAVATCPPFVARLFRGSTGKARGAGSHEASAPSSSPSLAGTRETPEPGTPLAPAALAALSDQQLCCLWRHTFWDLHDEETVDERLATVAVRQACLEELERRDPSAFAAWLSSGARASGGPERFLRPPAGSDGTDVV